MSEQQLHNTPPDAGARNRAPTEPEPALSHNTTLKVMSETENEIPASKPARDRSKKSANGEHDSTRETAHKRPESNAAENASPPLSPPPTPSTTSTSPETPASPASSRRPAKTRRKKQPARDIKPTATTGQADTPSEIASEAPPIEPEKKPTSSTKRRSPKPRKKFIKEVEPEVSPFEPDLDATPLKPRDTGHRASITVVAPVIEDEAEEIPETPLPPISGEAIPKTPLPPVEGMVRAGLAPALVTVHIPETPLPLVEQPRPGERRRVARTVLVLCLLVLFLTSSFLLWHDVNDTHLYLYHIDPVNGQVEAQQDLGGGYQDATTLTNPVLLQSSLLLGVSTSQSGPQQILTLAGSNTSWHVAARHSAQLAHSTLSVTPNNLLVVEYAGGLQVMTAGGQMLWQTTGEEPTLGAHAFAPAFDHSAVYTVKDASKGLVAAYDLRNGAARWTQHLDDTLAYAPPLLLYGDTVFVAGDHTLYALNTTTGVILWKAASPTRTLLIAYAAQPLLIAVGAPGLMAFDPATGRSIWSFNGQPNVADNATLTAAQFYQASISNTNNVIYATGIAWDAQRVQEQLWLFAVDASTGELHWSESIGSGFSNADAGRIFTPYVDSIQGLVLFEQVQADGSHALTAYNTGDGSLRWRIPLAGVTAATPNVIQASNEALSLFSAQTDTQTALRNWSWMHLLLLAISVASLFALLLLWILPFQLWVKKLKRALGRIPHTLLMPFILFARLWRFSRLLFALTLVAVLMSAGILTYTRLNHAQQFLNQVEASSGSAQWQQALNTPATLTGADSQGSFVITASGEHLSQLSALDSRGSSRWATFSSQGIFSLPTVSTRPGTLLVALSGFTSLNYHYAPDDAAYAHPLDHLFVLYLLDRGSGQVIWQSTVVRGGELQHSTVLGDDARFIYVASRSIARGNMVVQLIAVQKTTGVIAWRIFGPREQGNAAPDYGALLTGGRFIYWQANSTLYALDTELGQIQWRSYIAEKDSTSSTLEDAQMAQSAGVLLVRRSDLYHALDLSTGNERWTLAGLGSDTAQAPGGIIATGNEFILYGDGAIEAIDVATQNVLWKHQNMVAVSDVTVSADGSLIYAVVSNNLDGSALHQSLVAFDAKTTTVHWTFQPDSRALFLYPGAGSLHEAHGMLFVTLCLPGNTTPCGHQALYGLNAATGAVQWKISANRISNMQVTPDGSAVVFQTSSSIWEF